MSSSLGKSLALFTSAGFIGTLTQVVKGKVMAVLIGPAGIGIYTQLTSLFNLLFNLGSLGFRNGIIKRISVSIEEDDADTYQAQYATVLIFLSLLSITFIVVLSFFTAQISHYLFNDNGNNSDLVLVTLVAVPFSVLANFYRSMMSGHTAVKKIVVSQVLADVISLVPFMVLIYYEQLMGAVLSFVVYQCLKVLFYASYFYKISHFSFSKFPNVIYFNWIEIKKNLKFGVSGLLLTSTNIVVTIYVASFIIKALGTAEYGLYAMAIRVVTLYLGAIYANASSHYFPLLVKTKNVTELKETVMKTGRFYLYILPPLMALMMFGGEFFITLLFSAEFALSAVLLLLIIPGDFFRINAETISLPLLAKEKFVAYKSCYAIWAVTFLLLIHLVGSEHGIMGIAIAYCISQFISFLAAVLLSWVMLKVTLDIAYFVALCLGGCLITSAALSVLFTSSIIVTICCALILLSTWFVISLIQPEFKQLANSTVLKFKREKHV